MYTHAGNLYFKDLGIYYSYYIIIINLSFIDKNVYLVVTL